MKYEKPKLTIEQFELAKDIMAEGLSGNVNGGGFTHDDFINLDDDPFFFDFSTAIGNILDI